jgi:CheY-like chemotaxis protein
MANDERISVFSSENRANSAVYPLDALGLLVLMDGKATIGDLEQKAPHIPSQALRDLVRALMAGEGFEVSVAANRDEVVAGLRQPHLPDVVILDVMLPDVNGFDILQKLKAHPALKAVPVIMLTADAARESVMRGLAGGADGYITKPFEREKLLGGVRAVLGLGG